MKLIPVLLISVSLFAVNACDKPNKAAGEQEGFGISSAASGQPTRDKSNADREGEARPAHTPPSVTPSDKSH